MPHYFKVAQGCVLFCNGKKDKPHQAHGMKRGGEIVTSDDLPSSAVESNVASGHLIPVDAVTHADGTVRYVESQPGVEPPMVLRSDEVDADKDDPYREPVNVVKPKVVGVQASDAEAPEAEPKETVVGDPAKAVGKWSFDPAALEGKSLDELNSLILDHDDSVEPYETEAEAVAHLTQDR